MDPIEEFNKADVFVSNNAYEEASAIYIELRQKHLGLAPFCDYRLASISNNTGDPMTAFKLYYSAFSAKPDIALSLLGDNHPNQNYVFEGKKDERAATACPLCGNSDIQPKWCYPLPEAIGYNHFFNPIRLWMYCKPCHHIFAKYFPDKTFLYNDAPRTPNPGVFSYYSNILAQVAQYASGVSLFEVGIGACECLLTAREIGYDTFGIDVIDKHVQTARERFGFDALAVDFLEFQTDRNFDIIIMGDVLEHVSDPDLALRKACGLLNEDGALWVSTPNFDSAFASVAGHNDPMRFQQYHLNYFSRVSFFTLLEKCGLTPVYYSVSSHYNGSMEVIIVKSRRINGLEEESALLPDSRALVV